MKVKAAIPSAYEPLFFFMHDVKHPPYRYFDLEGGRSSGKSTTVALALVLEGSIYPTRILCGREYQNIIKDSVKKLLEDTINRYGITGYTTTLDSIRHENGTEFIFKGFHDNLEATVKSFEGIQRCWVEEAQTVSKESLNVLLPTIRADGSTIIFTRNPLTPEDEITRRFVTNATELTAQRTYHVHTTWRDLLKVHALPNEVLQQVKEAEGTPDFAHVWEGLPYEKTLNQIISWESLRQATLRTPDIEGGYGFGVDVARYGNDRTALTIKHGNHLEAIHSWHGTSLTESAVRIETYAAQYQPTYINVDDTGVGGGLTDILRAKGLSVSGINYGAKAKEPSKYPGVSDELWFDFAEQLPHITINKDLPDRTALFQELSTREWHINDRNLREVQKKRDYKKSQNTGSPDLADSVLLAYYRPAVMPSWDVEI